VLDGVARVCSGVRASVHAAVDQAGVGASIGTSVRASVRPGVRDPKRARVSRNEAGAADQNLARRAWRPRVLRDAAVHRTVVGAVREHRAGDGEAAENPFRHRNTLLAASTLHQSQLSRSSGTLLGWRARLR
jgi:hypothetical protein